MAAPKMNDRLRVIEKIMDCRRCDLYKSVDSPLPFRGATPARLAIIGDAPTLADHEAGSSFSDAIGDTLESLMADAGIDTDACVYLNVIQCSPGKTMDDKVMEACCTNVFNILKVAQPEYVLLLGEAALFSINEKVQFKHMRGRPIFKDGRVHLVTFHPRQVTKSRLFAEVLKEDLLNLRRMMDGDQNWTTLGGDSCSQCGEDTIWYAEDGVQSCFQHVPKAFHDWQERRRIMRDGPKVVEPKQLTITG